ncbi:MAG: beta strand repeat-containing protein, partial [Phascolarctobacterium sp.]
LEDSYIDILGGGYIEVNKDISDEQANGNYALGTSGGGHVAMNYDRETGKVGSKKVTLLGNLGMTRPDKIFDENTSLTLGLTTSDSSWTGIMDNQFFGTDKDAVAENTLYLQNGATWTNELYGKTYNSEANGSAWENFIGGTSSAKAGFIYQKDEKDINLVNYSGWTNVFYDHDVAENGDISFAAGDTVITNAAAGSGVTMMTGSNGVAKDNYADVLSSLAGKLYYLNYAENKDNLTAKVAITEGLTSPELAKYIKTMTFIEETGQGYYDSSKANAFVDMNPINLGVAPYDTTTIVSGDNTRITATNTEAIRVNETNLDLKAPGQIIEANVTTTGGHSVAHFDHSWDSTVENITADEFNLNLQAQSGASAVTATGYGTTNINSQMTINATTAANNSLNGIYLYYDEDVATFNVNGALIMRGENDTYGITNGNTVVSGMAANYGVTGILASGSYKYWGDTYRSAVNVNGRVDLLIDGTAVVATEGAKVNLNGGGSIAVNMAPAEGIANYALETLNSGSISFKDTAEEAGNIKGNVGVLGGGSINLSLTNADSEWTGVMHDAGGDATVTLQNGATWQNVNYGNTYAGKGEFKGSYVDTFVGGSSSELAGNIYQTDKNTLTMNSYSGWTNVYYEHDVDTPTDIIGGDTVINSAAANSGITLITQKGNIIDTQIVNVLNSLAQKLTYTANDGNLIGKVAIAEGLVTSSYATGDITFDQNGKGFYDVYAANTTSAESRIMLAAEGEDPITPVEPEAITTPLVAKGEEITIEGKVDIKLTEDGDAITAKGTATAPGVVTILGGGKIYAETAEYGYGNAVYAESGTVNLNPAGGNELIIKGDVVLKGVSGEDTVAPSNAYIVLDTATSSWQGNLYNDDASSATVVLQNGAIWNNRNENREEELGITGHRVASFIGGTSAETAGYFFQNNTENIVFDQYSGYTKVFFGHLNDGSAAGDYTAGNVIINSAEAGSNITMITNQSYNININDEEQVNKILNSLAGKLFYNGYAEGERNLVANVQIAESLTGSSAYLTGGVLNFDSASGQGYYGKLVHIDGIYTTDITGSTADTEFINAGVTEDFKTYNFTDSVEGEGASKVILQGIKVAGDTGNYKDEKDVTINIVADQAELNDSINVGYRGTVELRADTVTIKGVENTAIDNYGGTLTVDGNVEISDVANGIHTSSKAEVAGTEYIGTVNIEGQANITAKDTAIATEGGEVSVGAGSNITSTNGDAIVAQGQRLFSMQVGYYDKEVAGIVNVAGGTISAAKGNAINVAGGQVYVNEAGGNDTNITGNILVAEDNTYVGTQTEDTLQQSIVDITLDTKDSTWNGSLSVAEGQVMNLTLQNGAIWTDAVSELTGNTITNLVGGTSSDTAGTIRRNDTRDLTITNYSGWTNIYYEHAEDDATKMLGGDTVIKTATAGSGINMITGQYGVNTDDKEQVTAVLSALANKLFYEEAAEQKTEENGAEAVMLADVDEGAATTGFKLQAKALIAEGLTV